MITKKTIVELILNNDNNAKFRILVPNEALWYAVKDVILLEVYEMNEYFNFETLKDKNLDVCIDAGANVGTFSFKASSIFKRVFAIEPHHENFYLLNKNIKINNIKNITPIQYALSEKIGEYYLKLHEFSTHHHLQNDNYAVNNDQRILKVRTITLERIFYDYNLKHVDFLKMDIEGKEYNVILSSENILGKIDRITMELHNPHEIGDIKSILEKNGFKCFLYHSPAYKLYYTILKLVKNDKRIKGHYALKMKVLATYFASYMLSKLRRKKIDYGYLFAIRDELL